MLNKKISLALFCSLLALGVSVNKASAADAKKLYMTCAACHGKDGKTPLMPSYPKIAGQNKEYVYQQMKDIMSGARANGQSVAMKGVLVTPNGEPRFSDEELKILSEYVANMTP